MSGPTVNRVYGPVLAKARKMANLQSRMQKASDLIWSCFSTPIHDPDKTSDGHAHPAISWIGIYVYQPGSGADGADAMILGPCRDKPACSPIGLHGVCGRCWKDKRPVIVKDVATLGENYIACDPRDKSELCIPLLNDDGSCWGVLDADSHQADAFNDHDVKGMTMLCQRLGLTSSTAPAGETLRL